MELTFLGHAGFCVETEEAIVVMDPWVSPTGAFDSAWFQLPCNHHMAALVQEKLRVSHKERYIYISHEHKDHFDMSFLKSLSAQEITFIIPEYRRDYLFREIKTIDCKRIILCSDGESVPIAGGTVCIYIDDSELDRDSAVLLKTNHGTFLNLNDCKIHDRLQQIVQTHGHIDIFAAQFSGAVWHPTCYNYSQERYEAISRKKTASKFEAVTKAISYLNPTLYLASAGPACFLDPILLDKNFETTNIFSRAPKLLAYLRKRLSNSALCFAEPMPGDVYDSITNEWVVLAKERLTDRNFEGYVRQYSQRYESLFRARRQIPSSTQQLKVLERLTRVLSDKLDALVIRSRVPIPLYFRLIEAPQQMIRVDFQSYTVTYVKEIVESNYYSIEAHTLDIERVLDGLLTWEDFMLSFRMKLNRDPDIYHTVIHGFLTMEVADMNWFCEKVLDVESNVERTIVSVGEKRYSVHRYCPHQGADLSEGWVEQGKYLVCPRHRWKYDLDDDGRCIDSEASIKAFGIDDK